MDYDTLAEAYAANRGHDAAVLAALAGGGPVTAASRVLEVGCGTGSYVGALHAETSAACCGVDPSRAMLAIARAREPDVEFVCGAAEALPFAAARFDLVYSVDVVHHLDDVSAACAEAFRVLVPGGGVCVGTDDAETIRGRLHSRYFPETVDAELARYPAPEELRDALAGAGFAGILEQRIASPYLVADAAPFRDKAFSSLHLISHEAFRRGLERLEHALEAGPVDAVRRQLLVWARKP